METGLLRDGDWAPLDGQVCRVTSLTPLGFTKRMPYASIALESPLLPKPTTGFVTHKLDFEHLSEAFRLKENEPDAEVLIIWTKQFLKRSARLLSRAMPHKAKWRRPHNPPRRLRGSASRCLNESGLRVRLPRRCEES